MYIIDFLRCVNSRKIMKKIYIELQPQGKNFIRKNSDYYNNLCIRTIVDFIYFRFFSIPSHTFVFL